MDSTANELLRVSGLSAAYTAAEGSSVPALRSVNLEVREQEIVGVLGESGSGKSSLARAILRLLPANAQLSSGSVLFQGRDLLKLSAKELRAVRGAGIALISQEPALALNPVLTVGRQIEDVLRAHHSLARAVRRQKVRDMLREVGFSDPDRILQAYPHQLSGGQRQRAAIAQALVCGPKLLIADEPLSSLDTVTQAEILDLLARLKRDLKLAMLFITHNVRVLSALAGRAVVMHGGQVIAAGTLGELSGNTNPYVRGLLSPEEALGSPASPAAQASAGASPPSPSPFLEVRDLSKAFVQRHLFSRRKFSVQALDGIDFSINQGETLAVIGRSGSGKSTLARCIAGFEMPDRGQVLLPSASDRASRPVQMIFQDAGTALNPRFTAEQLIAEPMEIARQGAAVERRARALHLMEEVGLEPDWALRKAGEFSGGQRQRLALARALAAAPRLLILDESLSGLDFPLQAQMLRLLLELQKTHGLTYLYISHDLNFISFFAQEVVVMDAGRIAEKTTPARLAQSTHPATRALLEAAEKLHAAGVEVAP